MLRILNPLPSACVSTCGGLHRARVVCCRFLSEQANKAAGNSARKQADSVPGRPSFRVQQWLKQFKPHVRERLEFEHRNGYRRGYKHKDAPPQPIALGKQLIEAKAKEDPKFASQLSRVGANRIRKMQWWAANRSMVVQQQIREGPRLERERVHAWLMGSGDAPRLGDGRKQSPALGSGERKLLEASSGSGQKDSNRTRDSNWATENPGARREHSASVSKNRNGGEKGAEGAVSTTLGRSGLAGFRKAGMCTWASGALGGLGGGNVQPIYPMGIVPSILQVSQRGLATSTKKGGFDVSHPSKKPPKDQKWLDLLGPEGRSLDDYVKDLAKTRKDIAKVEGATGEDESQITKKEMMRVVRVVERDGADHTHVKYIGGWNPKRRLSRLQLEYVKELHEKMPQFHPVSKLATMFKVSEKAIKRILKSKFQPNEKRLAKLKERDMRQKEDKVAFFKQVGKNVLPGKKPKPL